MKGSSKPEKFFPLVQDVVAFLETNAPSRVKRVSQATSCVLTVSERMVRSMAR